MNKKYRLSRARFRRQLKALPIIPDELTSVVARHGEELPRQMLSVDYIKSLPFTVGLRELGNRSSSRI